MKRFSILLLAVLGIILAACSPAGTEAPSALDVKSVHPAANAVDVPVNTSVQVEFTGALDTQSLADAVALVSANGDVKGTYQFDAATNMLTFVPDELLAYGTQYSVGLSDWPRSQNGAALAQAVIWSFTTEAEPETEEPTDETPGDDEPGDETPGNEDPEDETPGDEDPEDGTPGDEDPEDGTPGAEDPEDPTPGDGDPDDPTPGDEEPGEDYPFDNPHVPSRDETKVVLPGVSTVSPMPWSEVDSNPNVEVVFDGDFDAGVLESGVRIKVYTWKPGFLRAVADRDDQPSVNATLIVDGNTVKLILDDTLTSERWHWVYVDIDLKDSLGNPLKDSDGNPLKGSAKWLFWTN